MNGALRRPHTMSVTVVGVVWVVWALCEAAFTLQSHVTQFYLLLKHCTLRSLSKSHKPTYSNLVLCLLATKIQRLVFFSLINRCLLYFLIYASLIFVLIEYHIYLCLKLWFNTRRVVVRKCPVTWTPPGQLLSQ